MNVGKEKYLRVKRGAKGYLVTILNVFVGSFPCVSFHCLCFLIGCSKEVWVLPWQVDKMEDVRSSASSTSDVYSPSPSTEVFVPEQLNPEVITHLYCV